MLQVCPRLALHAPLLSQVPVQLSVSSALFTCTQLPPGAEQVWQVPVQSLLVQQADVAMHMLLHGLNPEAHPDATHVFEDVSHCRAVPFCVGQSLSAQHPLLGTHLDPHFFMLPQLKSHFVPSHVAVPPEGAVQAVHEAPQFAMAVLATQLPEHRCICPVHVAPPVQTPGRVEPVRLELFS